MSEKRPMVSDNQFFIKAGFWVKSTKSYDFPQYRKCSCGKFSKPSKGKTLTFWDTHCRECNRLLNI